MHMLFHAHKQLCISLRYVVFVCMLWCQEAVPSADGGDTLQPSHNGGCWRHGRSCESPLHHSIMCQRCAIMLTWQSLGAKSVFTVCAAAEP